MIAFLRDLCSKDLGLKLLSLALAILIYSTVSILAFGSGQPSLSRLPSPLVERTFPNLPILVVSSAADVRPFRIIPAHVDVTVRGDPALLARLRSEEVRALVDLTGIESAKDLHQRIEVSVPAGIAQTRVQPAEVQVLPPKR